MTQEIMGDRGDRGITAVPEDVNKDIRNAVDGTFICPLCFQPSRILFLQQRIGTVTAGAFTHINTQVICYRHMNQDRPPLTAGKSRLDVEVT